MRRSLVLALTLAAAAGVPSLLHAQTPPQPASPQPTLPQQSGGPLPLTSSILGGSGSSSSAKQQGKRELTVRKGPSRFHRLTRRASYRHYASPVDVPRPALAGVTLVQPIPHPLQPPHAIVPVPAYPLDNFAAFYTTPPPPVVCRPARRDPDVPDAGLHRERPVICEADNP